MSLRRPAAACTNILCCPNVQVCKKYPIILKRLKQKANMRIKSGGLAKITIMKTEQDDVGFH